MSSSKRYPIYSNGRFSNYPGECPESVFWRSMVMFMQSWLKRRKKSLDTSDWISDPSDYKNQAGAHSIEWIGHASFLITLQGVKIITDPVFTDLFLFPRILPAAYTLKTAPHVDIVLISHNHLDHMDAATIRALYQRNPNIEFYVPFGDKKWFVSRGYHRVKECMWWETLTPICNPDLTLTFLPAMHWSQRALFDRNKSLWGSWMISDSLIHIYFAGDTAYSDHFKEIAREFTLIDYALMPIAPCEPHEWMKIAHIGAQEAVEAFGELCARNFIPMHWGAFWFGTDEFLLPIERLVSYWNKLNYSHENLHVLKIGQNLVLEEPRTILSDTSKIELSL